MIFTCVVHGDIMALYQQRPDTPTLTVQTRTYVYSCLISVTVNDSRNEIMKLRLFSFRLEVLTFLVCEGHVSCYLPALKAVVGFSSHIVF